MRVFTLSIAVRSLSLPFLPRGRRNLQLIRGIPGLLFAFEPPEASEILLLVFPTVSHAEQGQKLLRFRGLDVGKYIMDADVYELGGNRKKLIVHGPVDGWDSIDPEDQAAVMRAIRDREAARQSGQKRRR